MPENIDVERIVNHWNLTSDKDFNTMIHLFESNDNSWALFIGHIVLEKLLKASIVKFTHNHAPFTHDLTKLAKQTNLEFSETQLDFLDTITTFNLNARYDSYKQAFFTKCTADFTNEWINNIKELRLWIKNKQL